ncbi:carbon-nitrogen hydrolase family protein [Dermatophilus congolensis]|uniref:carbon-nitrogen hydrolase family protein n=1 Tax=Dermatophilus congolensis TaxID=1863 RepID=UPI001AAF837E|nr:carbon-nitrogen hydrolase family protein [Dermatophilus congolensis]MBO3129116.1 carbon-nitrogen hydrolase family protein [Dermatophilus congolensis]MBO3132247.1 carbon-nitrogen hydrolase family protein [Dermatophilus congolensis]MBO3133592.1 carbon-nitrogen hydrolase family protein [Dermatophilus congolensis]MBO3135825.1 carbon-nitrogen hydrolase family protein [Dermatophilus congolensis]MBO3138068.1 carbon-nitrogen hydrolase family protein [Dermatophilus congolensis]
MRIALAQTTTSRDLNTNLDLVHTWAHKAATHNADLVIFPEATMRAFGNRLTDIAEPLDGPWANHIRHIAATTNITIAVGMFTPATTPGKVRNTLLITGKNIDTHYDKIHLYDAFGFAESDTVEPGNTPVTVDIAGMRIGLTTCYDIRFPNLYTTLAKAGAHATIVAASWGTGVGKIHAWETLTTARALDSTTYILACGQARPAGATTSTAPTGAGHSRIITPTGETLTAAHEAPELLIADIDSDTVTIARRELPVLANTHEFH